MKNILLIKFPRCCISLSLALPLVASLATQSATAQQQEIEELVVTGSLIKRDNFDTATPLTVLDSVQLENLATPILGEIIRNLPFNYGTDSVTQILSNTPTEGNSAATNLRGLGSGATLQLIDGRRTAIGNVNQFYPQIAIERLEVLKDGAAALYGTDAVAGVVNFIPRKSYEGLEFRAFTQGREEGSWNESNFSFIGGGGNEDTHVVVALEFLERDRLMQREIPKYISSTSATSNSSLSISGDGNPGTWRVPSRGANGLLTGSNGRVVDPACGRGPDGSVINTTGSFEDQSVMNNNRNGILGGTTCFINFGEYFDYISDQQKWNAFTFIEHRFSDYLTFEGELVFSRQEIDSRSSPSSSSGRFADTNAILGAIAGEHPGNPYTALADRGNGPERVYATDLNGNGIPDRDFNGDGTVDPGNEGNVKAAVVLNPIDPFASTGPSCGPNGCVGFNEDVLVQNFRVFGKAPRGRPTSFLDSTGAAVGNEQNTRTSFRFSGGLNFEFPQTDTWTGSAYYTHHEFENQSFRGNQVFENIVAGLRVNIDEPTGTVSCGLLNQPGGNLGDCYNPWWTSQVNCVDRVCDMASVTPETSAAFNGPFVLDQLVVVEETITTNTLDTIDLLFTGDIFELPAGPIGFAFGSQIRKNEQDVDDSDLANVCGGWRNPCGLDFTLDRDVFAAFFETIIPVVSNDSLGYAEVQIAGRFTDYDDVGTDFTPKIAALWQPRDWLSLRASASESFVAPSLSNLSAPDISFQQSISSGTDYVNPEFEAFIVRTVRGNENLKPETSDNFNVGFTVTPLEGLSIGMDYFNFDFVDRLVSTNARQVLSLEEPRFEAFRITQADPGNFDAVRAAWLASGLENPAIERGPDGTLQNVFVSTQNAQTSEVKGLDFNIRYNFDAEQLPWIGGDWGNFTVNLNGAYMDSYKFALPDEAVRQVEGSRNDFTSSLPPLPDLVANLGINWNYGNNYLSIFVRHQGDVDQDGGRCFSGGVLNPARCDAEIDGLEIVDLTYSRTFNGLLGSDRVTRLSIGGKNIFDSLPDAFRELGGGLDVLLHDPRGRLWFASFSQTF